jgi:hypothetical protein
VIRHVPVLALAVGERRREQESAAVRVAGDRGRTGRPAAVSRVADAGSQPAVRQDLGGLADFGQCGLIGVFDVREALAGQLDGLAPGVAGRRRQRQPAQQRPELLPAVTAVGEVGAQRRSGLLCQAVSVAIPAALRVPVASPYSPLFSPNGPGSLPPATDYSPGVVEAQVGVALLQGLAELGVCWLAGHEGGSSPTVSDRSEGIPAFGERLLANLDKPSPG